MERIGLVALAWAVVACGPPPCTECPRVEGSYAVSLTHVSQIGGDLCPGRFNPEFDGTLTVGGTGSELTSFASGLSLRGQLSDDGQFSLDASDQSTPEAPAVTISGRFEAPNTVSGQWFIDAFVYGPEMRGTGYHAQPSDECSATATFTGSRAP